MALLPTGYHAEALNAKDFGCRGNGSDLDTAAVLLCFAAAKASQVGAIYFPPGSYPISDGATSDGGGGNQNQQTVNFSINTTGGTFTLSVSTLTK